MEERAEHMSPLILAAGQSLSARIRFTNANMLLNLALCRTDRGLCVFCFLCGIPVTFTQFLHFGWTDVLVKVWLLAGVAFAG